ncbi:hypothetical protein WME99_34555 [Sorangium sp. So ce136]
MPVVPEAQLAYVEPMKRDGWEIKEEAAFTIWLRHQTDQLYGDGPAARS